MEQVDIRTLLTQLAEVQVALSQSISVLASTLLQGKEQSVDIDSNLASIPTKEEVRCYAEERGYSPMIALDFYVFYESKGWMVGKNKIKDWRATFRSWAEDFSLTHPQSSR